MPFDFDKGLGLGVFVWAFAELACSLCIGSVPLDGRDCSKSGNLKASARPDEVDHRRSELLVVMADSEHTGLWPIAWLLWRESVHSSNSSWQPLKSFFEKSQPLSLIQLSKP